MSKFVSLKTALRERVHLENALKEMGCEISNSKKIKTLLGRSYDVDLTAKTAFGMIGFIKNRSGEFEIAGDDMVLASDKDFVGKLTQKYAYSRVVSEAQKAGFQLVKESVNEDQSVRLVLRKWNG
ncbi:MAG TPA: DUF1257 domain-containing protein [bacterium]|nr:DUF1257 domain-containing protein [bacterium]HMW31940.1 DUF1257 domain-containing protein [bacterium]HMW35249.1 DUF1257 domain-containing protein [bacterium]HMY34530.1 DUF1257 domain-containing protein [bacterium]HMZ03802.1 DUF1257 domain-containing protein [bacterium]